MHSKSRDSENCREKHTYWDRAATDESILATATRIISSKHKKSKKSISGKSKGGQRPFGDYKGAEECRRNIRQEFDQHVNTEVSIWEEEHIHEDPWEAEIRELERLRKIERKENGTQI